MSDCDSFFLHHYYSIVKFSRVQVSSEEREERQNSYMHTCSTLRERLELSFTGSRGFKCPENLFCLTTLLIQMNYAVRSSNLEALRPFGQFIIIMTSTVCSQNLIQVWIFKIDSSKDWEGLGKKSDRRASRGKLNLVDRQNDFNLSNLT